MIISNDDLRTLCIENDYFTCGTTEQYEKLFTANSLGASISDIALIIWLCSDDVPKYEIREKLEEAQQEHEASIKQKWDADTIEEFAKRLSEHYPHSDSILRAIEREKNKMLEEKVI